MDGKGQVGWQCAILRRHCGREIALCTCDSDRSQEAGLSGVPRVRQLVRTLKLTAVRSFSAEFGSEFKVSRRTLQENDVNVDGSNPFAPTSNGLAERHVGTILTAARAVLLEAKLPILCWDYLVGHDVW